MKLSTKKLIAISLACLALTGCNQELINCLSTSTSVQECSAFASEAELTGIDQGITTLGIDQGITTLGIDQGITTLGIDQGITTLGIDQG